MWMPAAMGMHWVGDLMLECEVEVQGEDGALDARSGRRGQAFSLYL